MQIATKSKIPKIISGIAAAILSIALGWLFLPKFWFWVSLEIIAALLVAIGCSGEWWLHHHPAGREKKKKDEHHKLESRFIAMVSLGVIMEFFALGHSIKEGKELEENLGQLESTNLVLRANVAALEVQVSQTSNNVAGMDPRLQPVLDMSATVVFVVTGTNFSNDLTNWDAQRVARMSLWVNEEILFLSNPIEAETFSRSDFNIAGSPKGKIILDLGRQANSRMYGVRFHSFNFLSALRIGFSVAAIDNVNLLKMEFNFLPHDSKIEVGSVDLVVNSCHKMFKIFPQVDTSPSNGIPGFPYLVLATNVSHDAIK